LADAARRFIRSSANDQVGAVVALYGSGHVLIPMELLADAGCKSSRIRKIIDEDHPAAAIASAPCCHVRTAIG